MSSKQRTVRNSMKTRIEAISALSGIAVQLEHADADIEVAMETALEAKGVAIAVLAPAGGTGDQVSGRARVNAVIPVVVLENRTVNMATGGYQVTSEELVELVIKAVIGLDTGYGIVELAPAGYARIEEDDGLITNLINFSAPVVI